MDVPFDLGPNFPITGSVEIPFDLVSRRLRTTHTSSIQITDWYDSETNPITNLWTDGSCCYHKQTLHTLGAFAIINENGCTVQKGSVLHFALSPYSCELWAMIIAFAEASSSVHVHTDSQTIQKQTETVLQTLEIPMVWSHHSWWTFFLDILKRRLSVNQHPLSISWIPGHILEDIPIDKITEQMAKSYKTTVRDIRLNRRADQVAKQALTESLGDLQKEWKLLTDKIFLHQKRLCEIAVEVTRLRKCHLENPPELDIDQQIDDRRISVHPFDLTLDHSTDDFATCLPRWTWYPVVADYQWMSSIGDVQLPRTSTISQDNWAKCLSFLKSLRWQLSPDSKTAFIELAYAFWYEGYRFVDLPQQVAAYCTLIRKCISQALKAFKDSPIVPGEIHTTCKSVGKTLPAGFVSGALPLFDTKPLKALALPLLHGRTHALKKWEVPF